MYISSSGESKDPKTLDTAYLVNALYKAYREIWGSETTEKFKQYGNNIMVLSVELEKRIEEEFSKRIGETNNE